MTQIGVYGFRADEESGPTVAGLKTRLEGIATALDLEEGIALLDRKSKITSKAATTSRR